MSLHRCRAGALRWGFTSIGKLLLLLWIVRTSLANVLRQLLSPLHPSTTLGGQAVATNQASLRPTLVVTFVDSDAIGQLLVHLRLLTLFQALCSRTVGCRPCFALCFVSTFVFCSHDRRHGRNPRVPPKLGWPVLGLTLLHLVLLVIASPVFISRIIFTNRLALRFESLHRLLHNLRGLAPNCVAKFRDRPRYCFVHVHLSEATKLANPFGQGIHESFNLLLRVLRVTASGRHG
mmetsp:Transcript_83045/g.221894  ORF Transcript_83045/g.221894 Transcript_83045/m.221894 type:complete len:234 (-) Transcript_83045:16-717(-)